jgi:hypothetical protein
MDRKKFLNAIKSIKSIKDPVMREWIKLMLLFRATTDPSKKELIRTRMDLFYRKFGPQPPYDLDEYTDEVGEVVEEPVERPGVRQFRMIAGRPVAISVEVPMEEGPEGYVRGKIKPKKKSGKRRKKR